MSKKGSRRRFRTRYRFLIQGSLFGLCFPIVGTIMEASRTGSDFSLSELLALHTANPLLAIIDTAPIFLGLFAYLLGRVSERTLAIQRARRREIEDFFERAKLQNAELKTANEALDGLLYSASHDLKTPVVNLKSMIQMLRAVLARPDNAEMVEQVIIRMEAATLRFETTLNDLLDISRIELHFADGMHWVDFETVVEAVMEEISPLIKSKAAVIHIECEEAPRVWFSRTGLHAVLKHLLANGVKYSHPDRQPNIILRSSIRQGQYCLEVRDNGVGINLDLHKESIFKMFKRLNKESQGTGLGLYIVQRTVEQGGGAIGVESEIGKGSCFSLHLPIPDKNAPGD